MTRQARHLARRLASHTGDARLPALSPWRFLAPVPRFRHRYPLSQVRISHSELLASGS